MAFDGSDKGGDARRIHGSSAHRRLEEQYGLQPAVLGGVEIVQGVARAEDIPNDDVERAVADTTGVRPEILRRNIREDHRRIGRVGGHRCHGNGTDGTAGEGGDERGGDRETAEAAQASWDHGYSGF